MPGTLFIVATPIGNLEDLTFRALRILREVDVIAAEDTRRTGKLLAHYQIQKTLLSVREHNEARVSAQLVGRLQAGQSVALVSDAGTPGIADPGARVVAAARENGIRIVPIPGPSAVATAISVAGFETESFLFRGFPPAAGQARRNWLAEVALEETAVVFFEAPHRIKRTLSELANLIGIRPIIVLREATKLNEWMAINPRSDSVTELGEFTVVVAPQERKAGDGFDVRYAIDTFVRMTNLAGLSEIDAIQAVAGLFQAKPSTIRKLLKKERIREKRAAESPA